MDVNELYMTRCIELAEKGLSTAPNPMVGAVLVHENRIIGEGFHRCFGEPHAEANAIASVKDESLLRDSTLYVSLEPCSHYGKTPPCAELIIKKRIPRVVVACLDPFPKVAGRGVEMLQKAGVEVFTGVMEQETTRLNRYFITSHKKKRPYIILKWAQSEDGFIDYLRKDASKKPVLLSTSLTRLMVHKLRSEVQAIMVGTNTALLDNPSLTVRYWAGNSPMRILIDRNLKVPNTWNLFDGQSSTLVFTSQNVAHKALAPATEKRTEFIRVDKLKPFLKTMMSILYERNIHSLLVEGGSTTHGSLLEENLWDELIVETAPVRLSEGVKASDIKNNPNVQKIKRETVKTSEEDVLKPSFLDFYINSKSEK